MLDPIEDSPPVPQPLECFKILETIFHNLELPDRRNARLVCNRWRQILDDPLAGFLVYRVQIRDGVSARSFMDSFRKYNAVMLEDLKDPLPVWNHWNSNYIPQIEQIYLGRNNSWENIIRFFKILCVNVIFLTIDNSSLAPIRPEQMLSALEATAFLNLTHLKFESLSSHRRRDKTTTEHIQSLISFLTHAKTPKVWSLRVIFTTKVLEHIDLLAEFIAELYKYLNRHTNCLRSLDLTVSARRRTSRVFEQNKIAITEDALPLEIQKSLKENLKLNKFTIQSTFKPGNSLLLPVNLDSPTLTEFQCTFEDWSLNESPKLRDVITRNAETLETLHFMMPKSPFDMALLKESKCLYSILLWTTRIINNSGLQFPSVRSLHLGLPALVVSGGSANSAPVWDMIINSFPNAEFIHWGENGFSDSSEAVSDPIPILQFQKLWLELKQLRTLEYKVRVEDGILDHVKRFCNWNYPEMSCKDTVVERDYRKHYSICIRSVKRSSSGS